MVQLPTEKDIGDLPDRLPRRMGVGSWQSQDSERGAQQLAQGGQRLGTDLGMLAGGIQQKDNEADLANAQSAFAVSNIKTSQSLAGTTDPNVAAAHSDMFPQNANDAASLIRDENMRSKFLLSAAPEVARSQVGVDNHVRGLVNNGEIANFNDASTGLINAAVGTDDEIQRKQALDGINMRLGSLVSRNIFTPEQAQVKAAELSDAYATARTDRAIARAKATGDTSELERLQEGFKFGPQDGNWSQPDAGVRVSPPTTTPQPVGGFANAVSRTLGFEGEKQVTDVNGAPVKFGINAAFNPDVDLKNLTPDKAASLYKQRYWDPIGGDALAAQNPALAHVAFDTSVMAGPQAAKLMLAESGGDPVKFMDIREQYLQGLANRNPDKYNSKVQKAWSDRDQGLRADISQPPAAAGAAPSASSAYFIGDSIADGLKTAAGGQGNTQQGRSPQMVQNAIATIDPADLKGKSIYLSSGASNAPSSVASVASQIETLKAKGVDPSQIKLLGVGDRADFAANKVNDQLAAIAKKEGVTFTGALDPTNLRRNPNDDSDNGVHFADWNKGLAQVGATPAAALGSAAAPGSGRGFLGIAPDGATGPNPHLIPAKAQWPSGATGVVQNADGTASYTMADGGAQRVPGYQATGAAGAPAPTGTGTFLDAMKPTRRAETGLKLQNAIDEIQRTNNSQVKQFTNFALGDLKNKMDELTSGNGIGDNEWASVQAHYAGANVPPEVRNAFANVALIKHNIESYKGMSPQAVTADIATNEARYNQAREANPDDPRLDQMKAVLDASKAYAKQYATEAVKTPLERAVKENFLPNGIKAIDPQSPTLDDDWAKRVSDAHTASDSLGVPTKYLQQSERASLRAVATQGGQPMVDMARHIVEGAGSDAGAVFKEIGVDAPMFQKIGELAASGGDPLAIQEIAGVINAQRDPAGRKNLPIFKDTDLRKVEDGDPLGAALARFGPDYDGRTRGAANMLMTSGAAHDGWDLQSDPNTAAFTKDFVHKAYNRALGATYDPDGTQWGGLTTRGGGFWGGEKVPTLVPNNMKAADFSGVIGSIDDTDLKRMANPPVGANGNPLTARQIQDSRLEAIPDADGIFRGKYVAFTDGERDNAHLARDAKGQPWTLDLADPNLDRSLRGKNPQSYQSATVPAPTLSAPPDQRYRNTPGVVALTGAAETD